MFIVHEQHLPIPKPHRHHGPLDPQRWHQQTAHSHDAIHTVCHLPCTVKTGIHHEENTSTKCQTPTNGAFAHLIRLRWWTAVIPDDDNGMQMSFPEMVSDSFFRNSLVMQTDCCSSCPGGLLSDDLGGEDAGCGGPGLVWLHVVCGCEAGWMYCQFSEKPLETAYSREMNIQFTGNSSGVHSCSQHANCTLPQSVAFCSCDKNCTF